MAIYLVNQGKTYKYERAGGYLWSPKLNKAGCQNKGYSLMQTVKKGDYILHNSGRKISAISVVQEDCKTGAQPQELKQGKTEKSWNDEGWIIKTQYYDFTTPILTSDLVEWAKKNYREDSAFQTNGRLRLQYLCMLNTLHANYLLGMVLHTETRTEVKCVLEAAQNGEQLAQNAGRRINKPRKWDEFETVLLIDTFWKIERNPENKKIYINDLSEKLRKRAIESGIKIDERFRNANGISMQLAPIGHAFFPERPTLNATSLFDEMVSLYKNDRDSFNCLLEEAKRQVEGINIEKGVKPKRIKVRVKRSPLPKPSSADITNECRPASEMNDLQVECNADKAIIAEVLKEKYPFGFKIDSIREMMRFQQFAEAKGLSVEDNDCLKRDILSVGISINDKIFWKNEELPHELRRKVNDIFASGVEVIYYDCLFEYESSWMTEHGIFSEQFLKDYLKQALPMYTYCKQFLLCGEKQTEKGAVTKEIKRVWGPAQVNAVDDINEKLPYIPLENIWRVISGNREFVRVSPGEYLFVDRFIIQREEISRIISYVNDCCQRDGFAFLKKIDITSTREINYELNDLTIYHAIYKKILAGKYYLRDTVLTDKPSELTTVDLLKRYLKNKEECSFDELSQVYIDLTGASNRQNVFQALFDEMIRIDKNHFVSEARVRFEVKEIDVVLQNHVKDHFISLQDVTTFAMFPVCGQDWNHYLLESYCYRFSEKYRLSIISFNDKNSGIIVEKSFNHSYDDLLALAVARSAIPLEENSAVSYLVEAGYLSKKKYAKMSNIVSRARELREER